MSSVLNQAALEGRQSGDLRAAVGILNADPKDRLAAALARLGRAFMARDSWVLPECTGCRETLPRIKSTCHSRRSRTDRRKERRIEQARAGFDYCAFWDVRRG